MELRNNTKNELYEQKLQYVVISTIKGKGKTIPLRAWRNPEGSSRLRLPDCRTIST
jgi:hypothetical protein